MQICKAKHLLSFKTFLQKNWAPRSKVVGIYNPTLNHLTKLVIGFSQFIKHKFKHNCPKLLTPYVLEV